MPLHPGLRGGGVAQRRVHEADAARPVLQRRERFGRGVLERVRWDPLAVEAVQEPAELRREPGDGGAGGMEAGRQEHVRADAGLGGAPLLRGRIGPGVGVDVDDHGGLPQCGLPQSWSGGLDAGGAHWCQGQVEGVAGCW